MHMATGVGTPVVALFGPTVGQFGFFPYRAPAVVLERPLDCRPCSATGTAHCPMGHHRCLGDIAPAEGAAAAQGLVPTSGRPRRAGSRHTGRSPPRAPGPP